MNTQVARAAGQAIKSAAGIVQELAPLPEYKNPVIAAVAGFAFGALGVAIYFRSAKDFFICLGIFLGLSVVLPGLGSILGWLFAPAYGAWRAHTSNQNAGL